MTPEQVLAKCKLVLHEALADFGTYPYYDKGPSEVLDVDRLTNMVDELEIPEQAWVLSCLGTEMHGMRLANNIFCDLYEEAENEDLRVELMKFPNGIEVGEY